MVQVCLYILQLSEECEQVLSLFSRKYGIVALYLSRSVSCKEAENVLSHYREKLIDFHLLFQEQVWIPGKVSTSLPGTF
jgi:hypothetical protein